VLGNVSVHEHFRRARIRSILALLALISAIVLVGGSSALAVAVFGGAILGMVVEMFMRPGDVDEPTHEHDGAGEARSEATPG
jgi:hypothetical protein